MIHARHFATLVTLFVGVSLNAQFVLNWEKNYGGSERDFIEDIIVDSNGDIVACGHSESDTLVVSVNDDGFDRLVSDNFGEFDYWITKVNAQGELLWERNLGGSEGDNATSILETDDGGYLVLGLAQSMDYNISENKGSNDVWLVKLNSVGHIVWARIIGGSGSDEPNKIIKSSEGGYLLVGNSWSSDGDISSNNGVKDGMILKLDDSGYIEWQKSYGGSYTDQIRNAIEIPGEGYLLVGDTDSNDFDIPGNNGKSDMWILKIDYDGNLFWSKTYGGSDHEGGLSIVQTDDDAFVVAGYTFSNDIDVNNGYGFGDGWIIKIDNDGNLIWEKTYGGSGRELIRTIIKGSDSTYVFSGDTNSSDFDIETNLGFQDVWIGRIDLDGNLMYSNTFGGDDTDVNRGLIKLPNQKYILGGASWSSNGDVGSNYGAYDFWIIEVEDPTSVSTNDFQIKNNINIYPNPSSGFINLESESQGILNIYTADQRKILTVDIQKGSNRIELNTSAKGILTLELRSGNQVWMEKLIRM